MRVNIEDIKKLRNQTGAGVSDCREALEEAKGDMDEAIKMIRKKGIERAAKKSNRQVKAGTVFSYIHHNGRVGAILGLACETDFVAKTEDFKNLGNELAMQAAATKPATLEELLEAEYMRDASKKVSDVIKEVVGKLGENIQVTDFRTIVV